MNIKNKPVIQVGQKDQIIINLKREIELFKMENKWLKQQLNKISGGEFEIESSRDSMRQQPLPPLHENELGPGNNVDFNDGRTTGNGSVRSRSNIGVSSSQQIQRPNQNQPNQLNDKLLKEYNFEIKRLRSENNQFRTKNM